MVMSCDVPKKQEAAILVHGFQYVTASWVWLLECSIQTKQYQEFNDWVETLSVTLEPSYITTFPSSKLFLDDPIITVKNTILNMMVISPIQCTSFDQNLSEQFNLGPLLFTIYASKPFEVIKDYLPQSHTYTDDTQLYLSFNADSACSQNDAVEAMEQCIQAIWLWMIKDKQQLNDSKTEFMKIGTRKQLTKVNIDGPSVGESIIAPITSVRNLGSWFDQNLSMIPHISKICKLHVFIFTI